MLDRITIGDGQEIKVIFESARPEWRQGAFLRTDGGFLANSQSVLKAIVLWQDTAPSEALLKVNTCKREVLVNNVWDVGDGIMHSWHNGAGMIVEQLASGRRYHCNDGNPDYACDDLVFRIELG